MRKALIAALLFSACRALPLGDRRLCKANQLAARFVSVRSFRAAPEEKDFDPRIFASQP
jgi:hypothetical protein